MTPLNARSLLYRYLLGEATDEEKRQVEERLSADNVYMERLQSAEEELIAAYVSECLTGAKRERFEKHFLVSGERLEKLRLAESLYEYARTGGAGSLNAGDILYRYLLGKATDEEKRQVEEKLLVDDDYKRRLEIAECELIAAYTLEHLTEAKRESFERYFLNSEENIGKLRLAEAVYEYYDYVERVEAQDGSIARLLDRLRRRLNEPVNLSLSRPIWQPLAAVLVISLGALIWALFFFQSPITRGLNNLYAAYTQERPIEARLTGFGYATYHAAQNRNVIASDRYKHDEAFRLIISRANEEKSAAAYHALGKIYLTDKDFNEAVKCFELAMQNNAGDAKLRNDLGVALMERAKAKNPSQSAGEDTALALEHLHRAIELDGSLLEAHFNLALCHQQQALWRTAEEDWKSYLGKDSLSPWAEEARNNLAKVTEKIKQPGENRENIYQDFVKSYSEHDVEQAWGSYKQSRVGAGSFITNRLIDNYLSLALSGESGEAEDNLSTLLFLGNLEMEKVKDRFTHDLAQFYRGASPRQLRTLSGARRLVTLATERLRQSRVGEAIGHYLQAIELFDQAGDVCESLATQRWLSHCYFRQASAALALPVLTKGHQECESHSYLRLLGLFLNDLANVNASQARYSRALDYGLSQVANAKRIEDDYSVLLGINRVTEAYILLARHREALPMAQEGLSIASMINVGPEQAIGLYLFASKSYTASGKLMAALDYAKEAFKLSLEINNPWVVSRHYVHLGLAYHKLKQDSEAIRLIRESGEIGKRLQDEKMSKEIMAFSHLHLGEVYRETGDLDNAIKSYGDTLQLYDENDISIQWLRFEAKKGMLFTHIKHGDDAAAEKELKQVLDLYEQHR